MKKLGLLLGLVACIIGAGRAPVTSASSELELWCKAQGLDWQADQNRCTIAQGAKASVSGSLALVSPNVLINRGTLTNSGTIDNSWEIYNEGLLNNVGDLQNNGYLYNARGLDNEGQIYFSNGGSYESLYSHHGWIANRGYISNQGTMNLEDSPFSNFGNLDNVGVLFLGEHTDAPSFENSGTLTNQGYVAQDQTFKNHGGIVNLGTFDIRNRAVLFNASALGNQGEVLNSGIIYNLCAGALDGNAVDNSESGSVYDLDGCFFLPATHK